MDRRDQMAGGWIKGFPSGSKFDRLNCRILIPFSAFVDFDEDEKEFLSKVEETIGIITGNEDEDVYIAFQCKMEVCSTCCGTGKHVNPSIDSHGITASEWAEEWDEEGREAYLSGAYDVTCYECGGSNVVPILCPIDPKDEIRTKLLSFLDEMANSRRECDEYSAMERRMGC